jgi:hypothetical protein
VPSPGSEAKSDAEFVPGSAIPHNDDLVVGARSVHITQWNLARLEAHEEYHARYSRRGALPERP